MNPISFPFNNAPEVESETHPPPSVILSYRTTTEFSVNSTIHLLLELPVLVFVSPIDPPVIIGGPFSTTNKPGAINITAPLPSPFFLYPNTENSVSSV